MLDMHRTIYGVLDQTKYDVHINRNYKKQEDEIVISKVETEEYVLISSEGVFYFDGIVLHKKEFSWY